MAANIFSLASNRRALLRALDETPRTPNGLRFPGDTADIIRGLLEEQLAVIDRALTERGVIAADLAELDAEAAQ